MERLADEVSRGLRAIASLADDATFQELLTIVFGVLSRDGSASEESLEGNEWISSTAARVPCPPAACRRGSTRNSAG